MTVEEQPSAVPRLTLEQLHAQSDVILQIAASHQATNVRVFGSVARGTANSHSDIDFLVDVDSTVRGFAYFGLLEDLRRSLCAALHQQVHVVDSAALKDLRKSILRDAVLL